MEYFDLMDEIDANNNKYLMHYDSSSDSDDSDDSYDDSDYWFDDNFRYDSDEELIFHLELDEPEFDFRELYEHSLACSKFKRRRRRRPVQLVMNKRFEAVVEYNFCVTQVIPLHTVM